jgi:hypothetical protein
MKKIVLLSAMCVYMALSANKTMAHQVASGATEDCTWKLTGTSGNYTLTILDIQQGITSSANAIGNYAFSSREVFPTLNFVQRDAGKLSPLLILLPATRADFPHSYFCSPRRGETFPTFNFVPRVAGRLSPLLILSNGTRGDFPHSYFCSPRRGQTFPTFNFAQRDAGSFSPLLILPNKTREGFPLLALHEFNLQYNKNQNKNF